MAIDMLFFEYRKTEEKFFEEFDPSCFNIKFFKEGLNETTIENIPQEVLENVTVISVFVNSIVNEAVIKKFKNLRIIATRSTGVDHIDIEYCRKNHIAVTNVHNYGATTVAQYTFAMILALIRKLIPANLYMKNGTQENHLFLGRDLMSLTLGVIGTGAIGGSVCQLGHAFGMNVIAYDFVPKEELIVKAGVKYLEMAEVLEQSDIITLHLPYTNDNYNMISMPMFEQMKRVPYFINTSRGELVNLRDLKEALDRKLIAGAALDVLTCEAYTFRCEDYCPAVEICQAGCLDELAIVKEIVNYENVIITPHIAYETQEAIDYILEISMNSVRDFFKGGNDNRVV